MIGSVLSSVYSAKVGEYLLGKPVPTPVKSQIEESLGFAIGAGGKLPGLADVARGAFVDGMHAGVLVAAGVALCGAIVAFAFLPARASYATEEEEAVALSERAAPLPPGTPDPAIAER